MQVAVANRVRIVLSMCDQRAEVPVSNTVIALGLSQFMDTSYAPDHSLMSRRIRAQRPWSPDLIHALCQWVAKEFGFHVDPGWLAYGDKTSAVPPEIPADVVLRESTGLEGLEPSSRNLRAILAAERHAYRKRHQ